GGRGHGDHVGNVDDQITRVGLLAYFAVHAQRQRYVERIGDLVGGDDPGPERAERVERLAHDALFLAAHDKVEQARIAEDVIERGRERNVATTLADDNRELALVMSFTVLERRQHDRVGRTA